MIERRAARVLTPLIQAGAILLLARVPALVAALPPLGLFDGPLGFALAAVAVGVALARRRPMPLPTPSPALLFVAASLVLAAAGWHYVDRLQSSGDEVEYLLMAQSLWRDGDLDLANNMARGDYLEYLPGFGPLHLGAYREDGRPISTHMPGLSFLLAPVYALGRRRACVAFLSLLAAAMAAQVHALARRFGADAQAAFVAWAAAIGPPAAFFTMHVYTEVPSAFAIAASLRLLLSSPGPVGAVVAALAVSALPWLHVKMIAVAAALGLMGVGRLRGRARLAFIVTGLLMAAGFFAYHWTIFGTPTPLALYGSRTPRQIRSARPLEAVAGILVDGSFGLLPYAPVFLLAGIALPAVVRRLGRDSAWLALVALAVVGPIVTWRTWWGGFCPPARFLVPLVPVLALAVSLRAAEAPRGLARWRGALLALGLAFALFLVARPEDSRLLSGRDEPTKAWEALAGTVSPDRFVAHLAAREPEGVRAAVVWLAAILVLLILDYCAQRSERVDRAFGGLALPLGLLLSACALVDLWARLAGSG